MKLTIDTKEDSHEEIKKVIKMLQNLVGDSEEMFSNQPVSDSSSSVGSPFVNIFGDTSASTPEVQSSDSSASESPSTEQTSESTEDLFAELFSEEELKKMEPVKDEEIKEEEEPKPKGKKYDIELY